VAIGARNAGADTVKQIAMEIKDDSVLPLRADVAELWAENLLAAQAAPGCDYCGPVSLADSVNSVLKAVSLEQSIDGLTFCNRTDCTIANEQSTIADNPNVSITIAPSRLDFGDVPVSTPEPSFWLLLVAGIGLLWIVLLRYPPKQPSLSQPGTL
jgi:hypothetical protein